MKKYDDYDYHVGGDFPDDVSDEHGWTHIGVFLVWLIDNDLHAAAWFDDFDRLAVLVAQVPNRAMNPAELLYECDGVLISEMLKPEGNAFANACYDHYVELFDETMAAYVNRSRSLVNRVARKSLTAYHADPGWPTYDVMQPVIRRLYDDWKSAPASDWSRNYRAMGDAKLLACVSELRERRGDAYDRVVSHGADVVEHLRTAEAIARDRGLL